MRYVITGGSGYIGSLLVARLIGRPATDRILVADVNPPRVFGHGVDYTALDVRDAGQVRALLEHERADVVVHLAAVGEADVGTMYEVNVAGTNNVLGAATAVGTGHVMTISTSAVYGRRDGDGPPLAEDAALRAPEDFEYAKHAATADRLCELWSARHQDRAMTIVRPVVVMGPRTDNFMTRIWTDENKARLMYEVDYMLLTNNVDFLKANPPVLAPGVSPDIEPAPWTDHYNNLFQLLIV